MINTPFWYENSSILYEKDYIFEFVPSKRFDINRKLNSIVRLSIIYSIIMYLIGKNNKYLIIPFITLCVTWIIWRKHTDTRVESVMNKSINNQLDDLVVINDLETECRVPTKDNPFMNPLLDEYNNNTLQKPKACPSYNNIGIQNRIEELFNQDLYRDVKDVFGKNNGQRQFYSVPGNQVPNDQGSFSQWCYGMPKTCKEGNQIACLSGLGRSGGSSSNP